MAGKPDFDVVVAQEYIDKSSSEKRTRWWKVGAGWTNKKGISFNICTLPGVSLSLFPVKTDDAGEQDDKF